METTDISYPLWMKRMAGTRQDILRIEEIVARYSHMLFSSGPVLHFISLDELAYIGNLLANLPSSREILLAPYSFADLYLSENPEIQTTFNKLSFSLQCKVLDTARAYNAAHPPYAMIAIDWESGSVQLLALSANKDELESLAIAFLSDPLTETMVDERYEEQKAYLLSKTKELLLVGKTEKRVGIYSVSCSDELFVNMVFAPILDCTFSLVLGDTKDQWGRALPTHIREADEDNPN